MKFRIKKDRDGYYFAEYKKIFFWFYVDGSVSANKNKTKEACMKLKIKDKVIESFEL